MNKREIKANGGEKMNACGNNNNEETRGKLLKRTNYV